MGYPYSLLDPWQDQCLGSLRAAELAVSRILQLIARCQPTRAAASLLDMSSPFEHSMTFGISELIQPPLRTPPSFKLAFPTSNRAAFNSNFSLSILSTFLILSPPPAAPLPPGAHLPLSG